MKKYDIHETDSWKRFVSPFCVSVQNKAQNYLVQNKGILMSMPVFQSSRDVNNMNITSSETGSIRYLLKLVWARSLTLPLLNTVTDIKAMKVCGLFDSHVEK